MICLMTIPSSSTQYILKKIINNHQYTLCDTNISANRFSLWLLRLKTKKNTYVDLTE